MPSPSRHLRTLLLLAMGLLGSGGPLRGPGAHASPLPSEWPGDPTGEVEEADNTLDDALSEALKGSDGGSGKTSGALVSPTKLPDLYFHDDERKLTVSTEEVIATVAAGWEVRSIEVVLEEQHAMVDMILPRVDVSGGYSIDRQAYGDFDEREDGSFTYVLRNVVASGVVALLVQGDTLALGRVVLKLKPEETRFEFTRDKRDSGFSDYVESAALGEALNKRLWRDLTLHLEAAARSRLRPALTRRPLSKLVPDPDARKQLQEYAYASTESANEFVDDVIELARKLVVEKHSNRVTIPDLREGFQRKVVIVTFSGSFHAARGSARGLASVHRNGESTFARSMNDTGFHIWGSVGFDDLTLNYENYDAEFMGIGPSGTLSAEVYPLRIHMHVNVDFDQDRIFLEEFRVEQAGDLQVEMTGFGWLLNWLASRIATWVMASYRDQVVERLEESYSNFFTESLAHTSLSDISSGKAWTDEVE